MKKQKGAPALSNSPTPQQLWDALGAKLIEATKGRLLYTQEVRGSSPLPPTIEVIISQHLSLLYDICFKKVLFSIFQ